MTDYISRQEFQLAHKELRQCTDELKTDMAAQNLAAQVWMTKLSENTLALSKAFSEHLVTTDQRIKKYDEIVDDYHAHKIADATTKELAAVYVGASSQRKSARVALRALYITAIGTFFSIAWIIYQIYNGLRLKGVI